MAFQIQITIDTNDSKETFINEIIAQNQGDAIQVLAQGDAIKFATVTPAQKESYVLAKFGEQFTSIYENTVLEREVNTFRQTKRDERKGDKR